MCENRIRQKFGKTPIHPFISHPKHYSLIQQILRVMTIIIRKTLLCTISSSNLLLLGNLYLSFHPIFFQLLNNIRYLPFMHMNMYLPYTGDIEGICAGVPCWHLATDSPTFYIAYQCPLILITCNVSLRRRERSLLQRLYKSHDEVEIFQISSSNEFSSNTREFRNHSPCHKILDFGFDIFKSSRKSEHGLALLLGLFIHSS
jgi:hypothetical protein